MKKKAQLKIQQMAFMLMAVILFFILVGIFYLVIKSQDLRKEATLEEKKNAIELANMLASSAEFSCGDYCIDTDRAMVLGKRLAYRNFWSVASIEIQKINGSKICTESNYPDCSIIKVYDKEKGKNTAYSFVSLCSRQKNEYEFKCELGKIIIGYEIK